jgi:hypothetical protein
MKKSDRRSNVVKRLEVQLKKGTKTAKKSTKQVPLTETDINRINKELDIIKAKS